MEMEKVCIYIFLSYTNGYFEIKSLNLQVNAIKNDQIQNYPKDEVNNSYLF